MQKNLYILIVIFIFSSILEGTDKFPYYLGKWNGETIYNDKNITIEFLPRTMKVSVNQNNRSINSTKYIESENNSIIVKSKMGFNKIFNTKSNQLKIEKIGEAIYIKNPDDSVLGKFYPSHIGKFPYFLGKWDGVTRHGAKDIVVEFLPHSIEMSIDGRKISYKNIKYSKLNYYNTLVKSKINFKALNIKSNQFIVQKYVDQEIDIKDLNGFNIIQLYPSNEDKLVNGWDMSSYSLRNKKCIFSTILYCYDSIKRESDLFSKKDAKFSFKTLKLTKDKVLIDLTTFDNNKLGSFRRIPNSIRDTIEYKTMHKCSTYLINTYSPSEFWNKIYKENKQLNQEIKKINLMVPL